MTSARTESVLLEAITQNSPPIIRAESVMGEAVLRYPAPPARVEAVTIDVVLGTPPPARVNSAMIEWVAKSRGAPAVGSAVFPTAAQFGYSVHRVPNFSTRVATAASGREVTSPFYSKTLTSFELTFEGLSSDPAGFQGLTPSGLQTVMGFFMARKGRYDSFRFQDPENYQVAGGYLGTGNASLVEFPLLRSIATTYEMIDHVNAVTAVYLNGVLQSGGSYVVVNPSSILFGTAVPSGVVVTADFTYYFVVRFTEDVQDYEEFLFRLHTLKSCKFKQVMLS